MKHLDGMMIIIILEGFTLKVLVQFLKNLFRKNMPILMGVVGY
jgi:hypothetical protein